MTTRPIWRDIFKAHSWRYRGVNSMFYGGIVFGWFLSPQSWFFLKCPSANQTPFLLVCWLQAKSGPPGNCASFHWLTPAPTRLSLEDIYQFWAQCLHLSWFVVPFHGIPHWLDPCQVGPWIPAYGLWKLGLFVNKTNLVVHGHLLDWNFCFANHHSCWFFLGAIAWINNNEPSAICGLSLCATSGLGGTTQYTLKITVRVPTSLFLLVNLYFFFPYLWLAKWPIAFVVYTRWFVETLLKEKLSQDKL